MNRLRDLSPFAAGRRSVLVVLLAFAAIAIAGCGDNKDDKSKQAKELEVEAGASTFAGPVPLKVQFTAKPIHSQGDVKYSWDFSDGSPKSTEQNPKHDFPKPDYYAVKFIASDEGGHKDISSLITRAYSKAAWDNRKESAKPENVNGTIKQSQIQYYTKYGEALPYDPHSDFYQNFPYLRAVLAKYERTNPAAAAKNRAKRANARAYHARELAKRRKLFEQARKDKEAKKQQSGSN